MTLVGARARGRIHPWLGSSPQPCPRPSRAPCTMLHEPRCAPSPVWKRPVPAGCHTRDRRAGRCRVRGGNRSKERGGGGVPGSAFLSPGVPTATSGCGPGAVAPATYLPLWHGAMEQPPGTARHSAASCAPRAARCKSSQGLPTRAQPRGGAVLGGGLSQDPLATLCQTLSILPVPILLPSVGPVVVMATGSRAPSRCRSLSSRARRRSVRGWPGPLPALQHCEHPQPQ